MIFKKKDKGEKNTRNLKHFFRREGEIDISFHWKLALVVFFFVGMLVVLLCVLVFFNIGQRVVFLDTTPKSEIQSIDKAKLDRVTEAYDLRVRQFEMAKEGLVAIPSPVEEVGEDLSEDASSEVLEEEEQIAP